MTVCNMHRLVIACMLGLLSACQYNQSKNAVQSVEANSFSISSVAKSDVNMIFDRQVMSIEKHLKELMLKLYLRNPTYWRHAGAGSAGQRTAYVFYLSDWLE